MVMLEWTLKVKLSIILLLCVVVSSAYAAADAYTMEDLQVLESQGKYAEVIEHMNDIRPSKRDDAWKTIVHHAVMSSLQQEMQTGNTSSALALAEEMLQNDPSWKESEEFMKLRGQAVIDDAAACYRNTYYAAECTERLTGLVNKTPEDRKLAFKAGKMARLKANSAAAIPFFLLALKDGKSTAVCADEDVLLAVELGMNLPPKNAKQARELGFSACFEELKPKLLAGFFASNGYAADNYCSALASKKMLTEFQQAYCLDRQ